jgi:hypothetical protein
VRVACTPGDDGSVNVSWSPSERRDDRVSPSRREPGQKGVVAPSSGQLEVWFASSTDDSGAWEHVTAVKLQLTEPLTATKLQRFPWKRMLAVADSGLRALWMPEDGAVSDASWQALHQAFGEEFANPAGLPPKRRPGRKGHPDEFYRAVADAYTSLVSNGVTNPTTRIAQLSEQFGYNRSTVAGWVSTARKKGYLPPGRRGRPG